MLKGKANTNYNSVLTPATAVLG